MKNLLLLLLILLTSATSQAALIKMDWEGTPSIDTDLTLDTETQLEWLDMSFTVGRSVNQVQVLLNDYLKGFRLANYYEFSELMDNAGIVKSGFYPKDVGEGENMATLFDLFGKTSFHIIEARLYDSKVFYPQGQIISWHLALISDQISTAAYRMPATDDYDAHPFYVGTFLVRNSTPTNDPFPIPEPSTLALLLAGLVPLGFYCSKVKARRLKQEIKV